MMQIVLAWYENGIINTKNINRNGSTADLRAAWLTITPGQRVYTYPITEPDPCLRARRDLIADNVWSSANLRRVNSVA